MSKVSSKGIDSTRSACGGRCSPALFPAVAPQKTMLGVGSQKGFMPKMTRVPMRLQWREGIFPLAPMGNLLCCASSLKRREGLEAVLHNYYSLLYLTRWCPRGISTAISGVLGSCWKNEGRNTSVNALSSQFSLGWIPWLFCYYWQNQSLVQEALCQWNTSFLSDQGGGAIRGV